MSRRALVGVGDARLRPPRGRREPGARALCRLLGSGGPGGAPGRYATRAPSTRRPGRRPHLPPADPAAPTSDAHRDAHARVITRQLGVKVGSRKGSFLNLAGVPATGPAIPPNTPGGEFLNRVSEVRVLPGAPHFEVGSIGFVYQFHSIDQYSPSSCALCV